MLQPRGSNVADTEMLEIIKNSDSVKKVEEVKNYWLNKIDTVLKKIFHESVENHDKQKGEDKEKEEEEVWESEDEEDEDEDEDVQQEEEEGDMVEQINDEMEKDVDNDNLVEKMNDLVEDDFVFMSLKLHDYNFKATSQYVLSYVAGFVARRSRRFTDCYYCAKSLESTANDSKRHAFIKRMDEGNLAYPSKELDDLIEYLENIVLSVIASQGVHVDTFRRIIDAIVKENEQENLHLEGETKKKIPGVGCEKHRYLLTKKVLMYFLYTRANFICKSYNNNTSGRKKQSKEFKKLAKVAVEKKKKNNLKEPEK